MRVRILMAHRWKQLGESMLDLTVDVASGERSVGEKAGHSQVSLWRDWKQTGPVDLDPLLTESEVKSGEPIPLDQPCVRQRSAECALGNNYNSAPSKLRKRVTAQTNSALILTDESLLWTNCTDDCTPL